MCSVCVCICGCAGICVWDIGVGDMGCLGVCIVCGCMVSVGRLCGCVCG